MSSWPRLQRRTSDPRVVISLTTVPGGVAGLGPTLLSLRNQSYPADAIELNLPLRSARGLGPYPELPAEDSEGVDLYRTEDWLALTNVIPTVQRARNQTGGTLVVVVDDDKVYPPSLVEDHVRAHRARPRSVSACRGYKVPPGGDISTAVFWPAWDELWHSTYGHRTSEVQRVAVVTGSDSWSVLAELLPDGLWRGLADGGPPAHGSTIRQAASLMNDIWVSGQLSRHGVQKFVVPCRREAKDAPRGEARDEQNLERAAQKRTALNMRVMQFFLRDWSSEEIMPREEVERRVWDTPPRRFTAPQPVAEPGLFEVLDWFRDALVRGVRATFLGE